jgi:Zn-dependent oligopeptidase
MTTHRVPGARLYCANLGRVVTVVSHDDEAHVTVRDEKGIEWQRAAWQLDDLDDALTHAWAVLHAVSKATQDETLTRLHVELSDHITARAVRGLTA